MAHRKRPTQRTAKIARLRARRGDRLQRGQPRARGYGGPARLQDAQQWVRHLLRRQAVSASVRGKVLRLVTHLFPHTSPLGTEQSLSWMVLLAQQSWLRPLEAWQTPGGSPGDRRDHLVRYLLARYPVPSFLFHSLAPTRRDREAIVFEDGWALSVLASLGRGRSLRSLVGTSVLPTPLTRRMCHDFLSAPRTLRPTVALRLAQVTAGGGPPALASALVRTRLGRLHPMLGATNERFWDPVIRWLCQNSDSTAMSHTALDALLCWIERQQRLGEPVRLTGRPLYAVLREVDQQRAAAQRAQGDRFTPSGIRESIQGLWSVHEILTPGDLHAEGAALRHCAWTYRDDILAHERALWSIRHSGKRTATVEVDLRLGCVVQARGFANRPCHPHEVDVLRRWASDNGLLMPGYAQ